MADRAGPYPFLKGHGTENDFVLLPDHDGTVHGELRAERVVALCDRFAIPLPDQHARFIAEHGGRSG